jgi:hypothetical protein
VIEEIHFLELPKMKEFKKESPVTWWLGVFKKFPFKSGRTDRKV